MLVWGSRCSKRGAESVSSYFLRRCLALGLFPIAQANGQTGATARLVACPFFFFFSVGMGIVGTPSSRGGGYTQLRAGVVPGVGDGNGMWTL